MNTLADPNRAHGALTPLLPSDGGGIGHSSTRVSAAMNYAEQLFSRELDVESGVAVDDHLSPTRAAVGTGIRCARRILVTVFTHKDRKRVGPDSFEGIETLVVGKRRGVCLLAAEFAIHPYAFDRNLRVLHYLENHARKGDVRGEDARGPWLRAGRTRRRRRGR